MVDEGNHGAGAQPGSGEDGAQKGGPDLSEANKRLNGENAALKEQLASLRKQRDELDAKLGEALTQDDVKAAVKAATDEAAKAYEGEKAKWAASNKKLAVQGSLAQAGCIDAAALMAHVDMEGIELNGGRFSDQSSTCKRAGKGKSESDVFRAIEIEYGVKIERIFKGSR